MSDLELPEGLDAYARDIACNEPTEKFYYATKYPPICVYCAKDIEWSEKEYYPQCTDCKQPKIQKIIMMYSYCTVVFYHLLLSFVTMMSLIYFMQHGNGEMFIVVYNTSS